MSERLASGKTLAKSRVISGGGAERICCPFGMSVGHTLEEYDTALRFGGGNRIMRTHVSFLRAVQHGEVGTIQRLIDGGADIDGVRERGLFRPLVLAAICGYQRPEVFRLLVEAGADPNVVCTEAPWDGWTPLFFACRHFHPDLVRLLLDRGADVNASDARGYNALMQFCKISFHWTDPANSIRPIAELLIDKGIDITKADRGGLTALSHASLYQNVEAARVLLAHGAAFDCVCSPFGREGLEGLEATSSQVRELNALFGSYLKHYWKLRVRLRLFGSLSEHLLDLHVAPFLIGDGILSKKRS